MKQRRRDQVLIIKEIIHLLKAKDCLNNLTYNNCIDFIISNSLTRTDIDTGRLAAMIISYIRENTTDFDVMWHISVYG